MTNHIGKSLAVIAAALVVASGLTACGSREPTVVSTTRSVTTNTEVMAPATTTVQRTTTTTSN